MEDYTSKYKGETVELALFGGEYQDGVLTAYCYLEDVPHIELNGHILVPAPERRQPPLHQPVRRAGRALAAPRADRRRAARALTRVGPRPGTTTGRAPCGTRP